MKKYKFIIFFLILSLIASAKESKTSIKFYPTNFFFGKLHYCSDFKLGIEHRFKERHRIEIAGHGSYPSFVFLFGSLVGSGLLGNNNNIQYLYGGGGCISYKYDLNKKNLYIGAKLSSSIYKTIGTTYAYYPSNDDWYPSSSSDLYRINLYMNSANFIFGWSSKTRSGIDIGLEIGYRYNRGFYLIKDRTIEMERNGSFYSYLRFPLRVGFDVSINLSTCFDKKYRREKKEYWFKE
jgi:hypothetical protein